MKGWAALFGVSVAYPKMVTVLVKCVSDAPERSSVKPQTTGRVAGRFRAG